MKTENLIRSLIYDLVESEEISSEMLRHADDVMVIIESLKELEAITEE